jgi:cyclopropane fatty-acyl-phospholipid synthase-like methyltransferase
VTDPHVERRSDGAFSRYDDIGAYHWREIGPGLIHHNAFTAERYRRVAAALEPLEGQRLLDYGCGDGAFLGHLGRRVRARIHELHGFDPNRTALKLAEPILQSHRIRATLHATLADVPNDLFDRISCMEVIEHASSPHDLIAEVARILEPNGSAVFPTPIRLTEYPEDPNHVREWFPDEFLELFADGPLSVVRHEQLIPSAAVEVYYWRPAFLATVPVFRFACNALSICAGLNMLSALGVRPRFFMTQLAVARKRP